MSPWVKFIAELYCPFAYLHISDYIPPLPVILRTNMLFCDISFKLNTVGKGIAKNTTSYKN